MNGRVYLNDDNSWCEDIFSNLYMGEYFLMLDEQNPPCVFQKVHGTIVLRFDNDGRLHRLVRGFGELEKVFPIPLYHALGYIGKWVKP
jgi:hypothetical protein